MLLCMHGNEELSYFGRKSSFFNITRNFHGLKATFSYLINGSFQQIKLQIYCIVTNTFISQTIFPCFLGSQKGKYFLQLLAALLLLFVSLLQPTCCLLVATYFICFSCSTLAILLIARHWLIMNRQSSYNGETHTNKILRIEL